MTLKSNLFGFTNIWFVSSNLPSFIVSIHITKSALKSFLVCGVGHIKSKYVNDIFLNSKEIKIFRHRLIKTKNTHGTGCTLSSAIATFLSCGKPIKKSCELGIKYVNHAIKANLKYGKGNGPINHLNSIKLKKIFN